MPTTYPSPPPRRVAFNAMEPERPVTIVAIPEAVTPVPPPPVIPPAPAAPAQVASPRPPSERSRLRRPDSVSKCCSISALVQARVHHTPLLLVSVTGQWPVPQVIIYYRDMKIAWGRDAIATMGKTVSSTLLQHSSAPASLTLMLTLPTPYCRRSS